MAAVAGYVDIMTSVGKYIILLLFIIHLTHKIATKPIAEFKKTLLPDIYVLALIMVIFRKLYSLFPSLQNDNQRIQPIRKQFIQIGNTAI